jgi:hypothetical protein
MSTKKKHQTESNRSHNARREHDRQARAHNADVYATSSGSGGGVSRNVRWVMAGIAVLVVVSLTVMFMAGWIEW